MKNHKQYTQNLFLLITLLLLTSCKAQKKTKPPTTDNQLLENIFLPPAQDPAAAQIGDYVVEIFEDSKGNRWFGTMAFGVARYDGKTLRYLTEEEGLAGNTVLSVREDKEGNLWFGTHTGASKYDPNALQKGKKAFTNFGPAEGLTGMGCNILIDRQGTIWAGTNHGAFRFDGKVFTKFDLPKPIIEAPSYKWERGKIWNLVEDKKGNIWFSRDGYGLCKYDPSATAKTSGKTFTHFTKKDGLPSNNVVDVVEDKQGALWIGTISSDFPKYIKVAGLCRYDGKTFTQFPELKGLSENDIYTIGKDKADNIWISALGIGAYRYDGKEFTLFNETDRNDLTTNFAFQSILEDRNGTMWFGFSGGLFRFNGTSFMNVTKGDLGGKMGKY